MATKKRDPGLIARDQAIVEMVREGTPFGAVASIYGITHARVSQIVKASYEDVTDEAYREGQRQQLEFALEKLYELLRAPGRKMVAPGGGVVYERNPDGTVDYTRPVYDEYVRTDVVRAICQVQDRMAKLYNLNLTKSRDRDDSREFAEAMDYVTKLAEENRQLRTEMARLSGQPGPVLEITDAEIVEDPPQAGHGPVS